MNPATAQKAIYVLCNYSLILQSKVEVGDALSDFAADSLLVDEEEDAAQQARRVHALRRGKLLDEHEDLSGNEGSDFDSDEEHDEEAGEEHSPQEIRWNLSAGLKVLPKPDRLGDEAVGMLIFMRWPEYGWLLGTITHRITNATPRLFARYNFRVRWSDGWENHKLLLDNYEGGASAPYNSWVLLEKESV
ncbi:hypothetical protein AB1Y20_013756 [Prymnesium parvum]|uniref:Uncharacterized protein n=1 Tax=Prymnesium parvum TaxID=97485 RepID=A0AB34IIB5_PRYPA